MRHYLLQISVIIIALTSCSRVEYYPDKQSVYEGTFILATKAAEFLIQETPLQDASSD